MIPINWCVKITEDNREVLEEYRSKMPSGFKEGNTCLDYDALGKYLIADDRFSDNMYWGWEQPEDYVLISYEDFKHFILKQTDTPEDLSFLIKLIKTL